MKKLFTLMLALMMVLSLAACNNPSTNDPEDTEPPATLDVDLSKYPVEFKDWTAQNIMDYFKEVVEFPEDCRSWNYGTDLWPEEPVYESAGIAKNDGSIQLMIYTFREDAPDTTPAQVKEWLDALRNSNPHIYSDEFTTIGPASHLANNVLFVYERTVDEDVYNAIEEAYQKLVAYFELTEDF